MIDLARKSLTDDEPVIDDVSERRRARADAFAQRRKQLDAAAGVRR